MVAEDPPHDSDDERDDLVALDFSVAESGQVESDLDALGDYAEDPAEDDDLPVPVFAVTNPPGTVTVTAFLDGRVKQVDLSPKVTEMTEADLADEIVVIAGLATADARSAQYAYMLEGMRRQGHDDVATRDFLARDLDLPTPDEAKAARAQLFSTRYAGGHDLATRWPLRQRSRNAGQLPGTLVRTLHRGHCSRRIRVRRMGGPDPLRRHRSRDAVPRVVFTLQLRPARRFSRDLDEQPQCKDPDRRHVRRHHLSDQLAASDHDGLRRARGLRRQLRRRDGGA